MCIALMAAAALNPNLEAIWKGISATTGPKLLQISSGIFAQRLDKSKVCNLEAPNIIFNRLQPRSTSWET